MINHVPIDCDTNIFINLQFSSPILLNTPTLFKVDSFRIIDLKNKEIERCIVLFKSEKLKQFRAIVLDEHFESVIRSIGELGLVHFSDLSQKLDQLGENVIEVKHSDLFYRLTSLSSRVEILINKLDPKPPKRKEESVLPKLGLTEQILLKYDDEIKEIETKLDEIEDRLKTIQDENPEDKAGKKQQKSLTKEITKEIIKFGETNAERILTLNEILTNEKYIEEIKTNCVATKNTRIIQGWVPAKKAEHLSAMLPASPSRPSVKLTALEKPAMIKITIGMYHNPISIFWATVGSATLRRSSP